MFTNKHVGDRDLKGDRDLRKQVLMPKDLCVALTQESDGSVFNGLKVSRNVGSVVVWVVLFMFI